MRQIIASAVIAASVFAAASPTPAQRTPRRQRPINRPTVTATPTIQTGGDPLAQFDSIQAVTSGLGVTIQWTMKEEKRVAIYQVFRTDSRGRVPVGSPVIGSAGKTRQEVMYGESYSAYDPQGTAGSVYDIEAIGMSGGLKADSWQVPASMDKNASLMAMAAEETAAASATNSQIESMTPTDAARPEAAVPNLTIQQWVASQPGVKIGVKADGLYRVTRAELDAAGLSTIAGSGNSANWKLFESGNEQAMLVGANDQYIEFIGRGLDTMVRLIMPMRTMGAPGIEPGTSRV